MPIVPWASISPVSSAADVAAPDGDQPLGLENSHRLAHRGQADPELLEQVLLPRQQVAFLQPSAENVVPQARSDNLGEPRLT